MPWGPDVWPGGRIWLSKYDEKTYVIRKMIRGRQYEVSTRCSTLRAAMVQLQRFEADPSNYQPASDGDDRIWFSEELRDEYLLWSEKEKKNTKGWVGRQKRLLKWWQERMKSCDLRRLDLQRDILPVLQGANDKAHRIAALKAFMSYLRKIRHLISTREDVTVDLAVPQGRPEQATRSKVIDPAYEAKVLGLLTDRWRDICLVLAGTGAHVTELERFAVDGTVMKTPTGWALRLPHTKAGTSHNIEVDEKTAQAADRVLALGPFSRSNLMKAVRAARRKVGPGFFQIGSYRHTVATRLVEAGASPEALAGYLGHKSPSTTQRFYSVHAITPRPQQR